MAARTPSILRLKIALQLVEPSIWRRIEIAADASFWDLHVAIQDAMGWLDCHLHQFEVADASGNDVRIGIPDDSGWGEPTEPGWKHKLSGVFRSPGDEALYTYDFGDGWKHVVVVEAIEPKQQSAARVGWRRVRPRCVRARVDRVQRS